MQKTRSRQKKALDRYAFKKRERIPGRRKVESPVEHGKET